MFKAIFAEGLPEIGEESAWNGPKRSACPEAFARTCLLPRPERAARRDRRGAHSAGAFGVPTFVVDDRMFWGNDRLVLVCHFLKK